MNETATLMMPPGPSSVQDTKNHVGPTQSLDAGPLLVVPTDGKKPTPRRTRASDSFTRSASKANAKGNKHFLGHGLRKFTMGALGVPAAVVSRVASDVVLYATNGVANLASAVAGPAAGLVGAVLSAAVGTFTALGPVREGQLAYGRCRNAITQLLEHTATVVENTVDFGLAILQVLLRGLGWCVGAIVTAPLMVFGRYES